MHKPRILEFSTYAKIGGTQKMLLESLRHASRDKFAYSMCVLLDHETLNDEVSRLGIENISLNMRGYWDVSAWWKLYRWAREKHFDLIRTYGLKADIIGRVIGRLLGIPVNITSVRSTDPWRKWYHVWLDRLTSGFVDVYLSNSEAGSRAVHQRERIAWEKIVIIPNGVDVELFHPDAVSISTVQSYRQKFGIPADAPILGIVANLCKMKGHTTLIDALVLLAEQIPNIHCVCVGTDFLNGDIQCYARERQIHSRMTFTGFRTDIPELLAMFDLFVLPSQWEGQPTALLEAMAMRKPVIATAVGGIPEIVTHNSTGFLIEPDNPRTLADAVTTLIRQPEQATALAKAGYGCVHRKFSIQVVVEHTENLYQQLIEQF